MVGGGAAQPELDPTAERPLPRQILIDTD